MNHQFSGTLETYYEQGMEQIALILYKEGSEFLTPNPEYDSLNPKKTCPFFKSFDGIVSINVGDVLEITHCEDAKQVGKVITIGNRELMIKDKYRFGKTYPKSGIEVIDWYMLFARETTKAKLIRPIKRVAFYGGTFDPIHNGHFEIIDQLRWKFDEVLILPSNNWTKSTALFPIEQRINSVRNVFKNQHNIQVLDWSLTEDTSSTLDMVKKIKDVYLVSPTIVIGADNVSNIEKWKSWDTLRKENFLIFGRPGYKVDESKFETLPLFWPTHKKEDISSTSIRDSKDLSQIPREALTFLDLDLLNMIKK